MTNSEWIKNLNDDNLAEILMCPMDSLGVIDIDCIAKKKGREYHPFMCDYCISEWLKKESGED